MQSKCKSFLSFASITLLLLVLTAFAPMAGATIRYVKADAVGANTGASWDDAYTNLQSALAVSVSGDEIWVAAGTYRPTSGTDRTLSFALKNGVGLYGGFTGMELLRIERDPAIHETILSGDIGTPGVSTDNSYHVVTAPSTITSSAILDGFTITGGRANASGHTAGGGFRLFCQTSTFPTISNCIFRANFATDWGGGVGINCGLAVGSGGNGTFTNCVFENNTSNVGGGAWFDNIQPTLTNCIFQGNVATFIGGGIDMSGTSTVKLINSVFRANRTSQSTSLTYRGGAISSTGSHIILMGCTLTENMAFRGSAIYTDFSGAFDNPTLGTITLKNTILWNNPWLSGGAINSNQPLGIDNRPIPAAPKTIQNSDVEGQGFPSAPADGNGNFAADPRFVNGTLLLGSTSPCIDTGNNTLIPAGVTTDLAGNDRIVNGTVDIGAYELQLGQPPTANDDDYSTDEDTPLTVNAANGVLSNDSDPEGASLSAELVNGPSQGSLTLNADGSFTYTPNANYNGPDSFTYQASDGLLSSAPVTVSITVNAINDVPEAADDTYSTDEDTPLTVAAAGVLSNDTDAEGEPLTAVLVSGPSHGTLTLHADGSFTYTPDADYNGSDSFTYKANDGTVDSSPATVSLTVNSVNDVPTADGQPVTTDEDTPVSGQLTGSDVDNDMLTFEQASGPAHGMVVVNADGSFTYTPDANYNGPDSFTFKVNDGTVDSSPATVSITVNPVNDVPVAVDDSYTTNEDTTLTIVAADGVLKNDSDIEGDALTAVKVSGPSHGTLTLNADGSFTYTPSANYNGSDSFTYKANDGTADSNTVTVSIAINPVNDAPVADAQMVTTNEDTPYSGTLTGSDSDGNALTFAKVSGPAHGTVTVNANGSFTYTPAANYNGPDSFTFKVNDNTVDSNAATVSITVNSVNDAPTASGQSVTTNEDTPVSGQLTGSDVDNDRLTFVKASDPAHGTVTVNADGSFTYTPSANYNGPDSFTFKVNDGTVDSNTATVSITVKSVNDAPTADGQSVTTNEDTPVSGQLVGNDVDNDRLTFIKVSNPAHGTVVVNSNGSFTYTPAANYNGLDSFTFKVNDGTVDSNTATVSITVNPINDAPLANNDAYSTNQDTTLTVAAPGVLGNDTDVEGSPLRAVLVAGPAHGTLTLNTNGSFTYIPAANYSGPDSFTYKANDGSVDSNVATVNLTVNAVARLVIEQVTLKRSGTSVQVKFNIRNTGTVTATGVTITEATLAGALSKPSVPISEKNIAGGTSLSETLSFKVDAGIRLLTIRGTSSLGSFSYSQNVQVP